MIRLGKQQQHIHDLRLRRVRKVVVVAANVEQRSGEGLEETFLGEDAAEIVAGGWALRDGWMGE